MPHYCVVLFPKEKTVEVITSKWLFDNDSQCYWPDKVKGGQLAAYVKSHRFPPNIQCKVYSCKVLKTSGSRFTTKTYEKLLQCISLQKLLLFVFL